MIVNKVFAKFMEVFILGIRSTDWAYTMQFCDISVHGTLISLEIFEHLAIETTQI